MNMGPEIFEQIRSAYKDMSSQAKYRPAAPSDGLGNITVPIERLSLEREAAAYAKQWWKQEDDFNFFLGCCDFSSRRATIYAIEVARNMCAGRGGDATALALLKMAVKELESVRHRESRAVKGSEEMSNVD
jgi:hypothetical protein